MASLSQFLALLETQNGRDKFYRLIVYSSRLMQWVVDKQLGTTWPKLKIIDENLTDARKLFRVLKWMRFVRDMVLMQGKPLSFIRLISQLRLFALTLLHLHQQVMWLAKMKLIAVADRPAIARKAGAWWLLSLVCSHILNYHQWVALKAESQALKQSGEADREKKLKNIEKTSDLWVKVIQDSANSPLAYINSRGLKQQFGLGFIGFCGTVSSLAGIRLLWPKK